MRCQSCESEERSAENVVTRGRTAVPGCVEGAVRVVLDPVEADSVVTGEVLVTPMTDPESVPAMERAGAVVTERGGMLCHAAIVCREMGKPCIVGTANATTALATGARVRVCATRGVVVALPAVPGVSVA